MDYVRNGLESALDKVGKLCETHQQSQTSTMDPGLNKVQQAEEVLKSAEATLSKLKNDTSIFQYVSKGNIVKATESVKKATKELALAIFEVDDFRELNQEFSYKYYEFDVYGMRTGDAINKTVNMDRPRECHYNKTDCRGKPTEKLVWNESGEKWEPEVGPAASTEVPATSSNRSPRPEQDVQYSAITFHQLLAVQANVKRRCKKEKWTNFKGELLTPETVSLYDVQKYIILPYTVHSGQSFVNTLPSTGGSQPPRLFVSHWWGEPVADFIRCVEQLQRDFSINQDEEDDRNGGGMTADTPIWVCAYANNQWLLDDAIPDDPSESSFTKAMAVAEGRTVTILDKDGEVFRRIWCCFELFLVFMGLKIKDATTAIVQKGKGTDAKDILWCVYTALNHTYKNFYGHEEEREAVGIVSGGALIDGGQTYNTAAREQPFPFHLISMAPTIKIEDGKASQEPDRVHILNAVVGKTGERINDVPMLKHQAYDEVNDALRARFVSAGDRMMNAWKEGGDVYESFLTALKRGNSVIDMSLNFREDGWSGLTADRTVDLIRHLPPTVRQLRIFDANFGKAFLDAVIDHVEKSPTVTELWLNGTKAGGEEGQSVGERLADVLSTNDTMEKLGLLGTDLLVSDNVDAWINAIMKNTTLTTLYASKGEAGNKLEEGVKDRTPKLDIGLY